MIKPKKTIADLDLSDTDEYKLNWRLKLDMNENIYGASEFALSAVRNFNPEDMTLYPKCGQFIDKLSEKYNVNFDNIILTTGCDESLNIIINTYLDKDDEFVSFSHYCSKAVLYAQACKKNIRFIDLNEEFDFDIEKTRKSFLENTKIFYVKTPDDLTGKTIRASVIAKLAEEFENVLFVIDCDYVNFASSVAFSDYIDLIARLPNVLVLKSFSSDYALAGLSLGFILSDKNNIENLKKLPAYNNINAVALSCAIASMNDNNYLEKIRELNIEARELMYEGLCELGYRPFKSEANFLLCDFGEYREFFYNKLKYNGIIVKNCSDKPIFKNCLRITVPKKGGVRYILELLKIRDLIIIDSDNVILEIKNSYMKALKKTCELYLDSEVQVENIKEIKYAFNLNSYFEAIRRLLIEANIFVDIEQIINTFNNIFYNEKVKKDDYLIDNDELIISPDILDELAKNYDIVLYTTREKPEILYSLKKFDIEKYFYYVGTRNYFETNEFKKAYSEIVELLKHCPYKNVKFIASETESIVGAKTAQIETIGIIVDEKEKSSSVNNFRHLGVSKIIYNAESILEYLK